MESQHTTKFKLNGFTHFLLKFCCLLILVFIIDFTIGGILRYFYFRQDSGPQFRTTYAIRNVQTDILVFGSSRANHHYEPESFKDSLNLSFYNAGRDGNFIFYHYAVLKSVLARYTPRIVILDVSSDDLNINTESYDRISSLLPYYKSHPEMRSVIEMKSEHEKIKLLSSIYPFNSSVFTIAVGNTEFNKSRAADRDGFVPLPVNRQTIHIPVTYEEAHNPDSEKIKLFESFIRDCKSSGSELYLVCSPYFRGSKNMDRNISLVSTIAKRQRVPFLNFYNDPSFYARPELFTDAKHLNSDGARAFSRRVANSIKLRRISY